MRSFDGHGCAEAEFGEKTLACLGGGDLIEKPCGRRECAHASSLELLNDRADIVWLREGGNSPEDRV